MLPIKKIFMDFIKRGCKLKYFRPKLRSPCRHTSHDKYLAKCATQRGRGRTTQNSRRGTQKMPEWVSAFFTELPPVQAEETKQRAWRTYLAIKFHFCVHCNDLYVESLRLFSPQRVKTQSWRQGTCHDVDLPIVSFFQNAISARRTETGRRTGVIILLLRFPGCLSN